MYRGRYECCKALLRAGADPNYINRGADLTLFWAIDGGIEIIKLMHQYGVNMDARYSSTSSWHCPLKRITEAPLLIVQNFFSESCHSAFASRRSNRARYLPGALH